MKQALILANGTPPRKAILRECRKQSELFVCADGGANAAAALGERPDFIIGDLDSIKSSTVRKFNSVRTHRVSDQNSTDLEKALNWVIRRGYKEIVVLGATGGRVDHVAGNLSALGKFSRSVSVKFIDNDGMMMAVGSYLTYEAEPGTTISLIPLSRCEGIVTEGLKWELWNGVLELGVREGTSNVVKASPFTIKVRRGVLLLYVLNKFSVTGS